MMPPTGLTLFIHAFVILLKKGANVLHKPFCENTYTPETTARQAVSSFAIISLVFTYIFALVGSFVYTAAVDDRATWKVVRHLYDTYEPPRFFTNPPPLPFDTIAEEEADQSSLLLVSLDHSSHSTTP